MPPLSVATSAVMENAVCLERATNRAGIGGMLGLPGDAARVLVCAIDLLCDKTAANSTGITAGSIPVRAE